MAAPAAGTGIRLDTVFRRYVDGFDECEVNGVKFALFTEARNYPTNLTIDLPDRNVVILAPLEAEGNITIRAISIIALNNLTSRQGEINVLASGRWISLGAQVSSFKDNKIRSTLDCLFLPIVLERSEMIKREFTEGFSERKGQKILDALADTFDAVHNPDPEEGEDIEYAEVFRFFNIPTGVV